MRSPESPSQKSTPGISRARISLVLAALIASCSIAAKKWNVVGEQRRKVKWVIDGDTFKVCPDSDNKCSRKEQVSIRVKGLECPESNQRACDRKPDADCSEWIPKGKEAKKVAIRTLKKKTVTLQPTGKGGSFESGGYKRPLAYVKMPNGSDYGLTMIEKGLCQDFSHRYRHNREDQYRAAQKKAGVFPLKPKK